MADPSTKGSTYLFVSYPLGLCVGIVLPTYTYTLGRQKDKSTTYYYYYYYYYYY